MKNCYLPNPIRLSKLALLIVCCHVFSLAQAGTFFDDLSATGSNRMLRAVGNERSLSSDQNSRLSYFENFFEARISYRTEWQLGFRNSYFIPSYWKERKVGFDTFNKYWLQFDNGTFMARAGSVYTIWGRGLTLSLQEDIDQGLDAGINGGMVRYSQGIVKAEAIAGTTHADPASFTRTNQIYGANVDVSKYNARLGINYLKVPEKSYQAQSLQGGYAGYQTKINKIGTVAVWAEGSWQKYDTASIYKDRGIFGSISLARKGFSINFDFKDYRFAESYSNILPFQSPPVVQRDLITKLMSSHPHILRYTDEVGWQTEINFRPFKKLGIVVYNAESSLHNDTPFPSMKQIYSPSTESLIETTWKYNRSGALRLQYSRHEESAWNDFAGIPQSWDLRNGVLVGWQTSLIYSFTLDATVEQMVTRDKIEETDITDKYASATISYPGIGSVAFSYDHTSGIGEAGGPDWFSTEMTLPIQQNLQVQAFFGEERGGIKCSSGRCRQVNPFEGFRIGVEATF